MSTGKLHNFDLKQHHCQRIEELMEKYKDLPMDLADASLVILAEELGHGQILSVDYRDFNTYRWKNTEPFDNLFNKFLWFSAIAKRDLGIAQFPLSYASLT